MYSRTSECIPQAILDENSQARGESRTFCTLYISPIRIKAPLTKIFGKYLPFFKSISFYLEVAVPLPFGTLFCVISWGKNIFNSVYCCERYIQSWNADPLENRRNLPTLIGRLRPLSCFYQPISANLLY